MKTLAIIPARGGSKGIKDKNIVDVCGKPLIAYSIEHASTLMQAGLIEKALVSTDSERIAYIAREWGAEVPFLRPKELASDTAKSIDFVLHALDFLEEQHQLFDAVLLLQPTSPIRPFTILKEAIEKFKRLGAESLISCFMDEHINELVMYTTTDNSTLRPKHPDHNKGIRRQEYGRTLVRNGAIYLTRVDYLRRTQQIISDEPAFVEMNKMDSINLDSHDDLDLLRTIMDKR